MAIRAARRILVAMLGVLPLLLAACSGGSGPEAGPAGGVHSTSTQERQPTLGRTGAWFGGTGFGRVAPGEVYTGGDPTGMVSHIRWRRWGKARAIGTGSSVYVGPDQTVAEGAEEPVTIVAFDLGQCQGDFVYQAVEWYFPQHGQRLDTGHFEDGCTGTAFPPQTGRYQDAATTGGPGAAHYVLDLVGAPALSGTVDYSAAGGALTEVFAFAGTAEPDGTLTLHDRAPSGREERHPGTWSNGRITLEGCQAYLRALAARPPSCAFQL